MIEVFKTGVIKDDVEREEALAVIDERREYYERLFAHTSQSPRISVRFEGARPLIVRIMFVPASGQVAVIDTPSYQSPAAAVKHAFKKLRRVAKNHFEKAKKLSRT